ncbi:hypothetical protein EXIGLDRAFT_769832 [Exidia glandulosa HHB12029]|uniref:Uncharacterized protein n=1 Tax=Exidia glandulosa HHB12029 TaxID=1314781 RepID=A0A165H5M5_EXIGL|nr:hypothetical protein EXIGLDRAFT_769832 [Exidia glandulosa HHB12029]
MSSYHYGSHSHYSQPTPTYPATQPYAAHASGQVGLSQHYHPSHPPVAHHAHSVPLPITGPPASRQPVRKPSFTPEIEYGGRTPRPHDAARPPQPRVAAPPHVAPGTFAIITLDHTWLREVFGHDVANMNRYASMFFLVIVHECVGPEISFMFVWKHPPGQAEARLNLPLKPMPHHRVRINAQDYRWVNVPSYPFTHNMAVPGPVLDCIWTSPPVKVIAKTVSLTSTAVSLGSYISTLQKCATEDLLAQGLQWMHKPGSAVATAHTGYIDDARVNITTDIHALAGRLPTDPGELLRLLNSARG